MTLPTLLPGTRNVLIVSLVVFVAYVVLARGVGLPLAGFLAIAPGPSIGWSWQWATHWVVSDDGGGAFRKLIELLIVYLMGSQYEALAGPRRLYGLLVVGVLGAAAGIFATIWLTPLASFGDAAMTSALVCALAVRSGGREVSVPVLGTTSPWLFVVIFGAVALLDAIYFHFAPVAGAYFGACGAAYLYERWAMRAPTRASPRAKPRAGGPFRVIRGGADDDERPKYLN